METFRSRLQKGVVTEKDWEELYILARHWKDDLYFYQEDLQFLQKLIGRYSIWITSKDNGKTTNNLLSDLQRLNKDSKTILVELDQHLQNLSSLMQGNGSLNQEDVLEDQVDLEEQIATFIKGFRKNRQQAYRVSEQIMDSEDLSDHFK